MAIIKVKRGTTIPTTSQLTELGEIGFDRTNNDLYIRGQSSVVKIGSSEEMVYKYIDNDSSHLINHILSNNYIYKLYIFASTNYRGNDNSQTSIQYRSSSGSNFLGSYLSVSYNDVYASVTKVSSRNISTFNINDSFSNGVTPSYAITKTISAEILPSFESNTISTYQWIIEGRSITSVSDQSNASITMADFVHSVDGSIGQIFVDPGLDLGATDTIQISLFRKKRN